MKRKALIVTGAILGGLVLLLLLLTAAAPLLVRLGLQPVCIQGQWPDLQIVSCPAPAQAEMAVTPFPTQAGQQPLPIIVDDDGSPDGVLALLYFLSNPRFDVRAVTVSYGEAHPELFSRHIAQLLAGVGRADIPVGFGQDAPLEGNNAFPEPWRQGSDDFWGLELPAAQAPTNPVPAPELIVQTLSESEQTVVVFVSGAHTNLAQALRLAPDITGKIREVLIMGGSVYAPGNIKSDWPAIDNTVAEWNIWVDPLAASEVFSSGVPLRLAPLDSTQKVRWGQADARAWALSASPQGKRAGDLLLQLLKAWSSSGVYLWDLAAAISLSEPALCPPTALALDVIVAAGPDQGRTVPVAGQPANAWVCLAPDAERVKAYAAANLGR